MTGRADTHCVSETSWGWEGEAPLVMVLDGLPSLFTVLGSRVDRGFVFRKVRDGVVDMESDVHGEVERALGDL